jgi:hypothetical protein
MLSADYSVDLSGDSVAAFLFANKSSSPLHDKEHAMRNKWLPCHHKHIDINWDNAGRVEWPCLLRGDRWHIFCKNEQSQPMHVVLSLLSFFSYNNGMEETPDGQK